MKIVSVYQTDIGTRVEFEGDAWTIEDPITCLMDKEGWLFFIATEERGERTAKAAVRADGLELTPVDLREFPESEYTEISGYTLGLVVMPLGGWEKIWTALERGIKMTKLEWIEIAHRAVSHLIAETHIDEITEGGADYENLAESGYTILSDSISDTEYAVGYVGHVPVLIDWDDEGMFAFVCDEGTVYEQPHQGHCFKVVRVP